MFMPQFGASLDELADRMGILAEFLDAKGAVIRTSVDTKRKLLAAMGVEVATAEQAQAALRSVDRAAWTQTLAPVKVLRDGLDPPAIELVLPQGTGLVTWATDDGRGY
jgi:hypothetical protein